MRSVNKELWQEWQRNNVTLQVMDQIKDRIEEAKDQLIGPSNERDFDQYVKGMIRGFQEVLDVQLDLTIEEDSEDEVSSGDFSTSGN